MAGRGAIFALFLPAMLPCLAAFPAYASDEGRPPVRSLQADAGVPKAPAQPPAWLQYMEDDLGFITCLAALRAIGAEYEVLPPQSGEGNPDCGIVRPLQIRSVLGVEVEGGAMMRCDTALSLARWMQDFAIPAMGYLPDAPLPVAIQAGSTYQCRSRIGDDSGKPSQHGLGNAFDIAGFSFAQPTGAAGELGIAPRDGQGDIAEAVQAALQTSACLFFTTVLGPGSDAAHGDHLHLDVIRRPNGWRICQ